MLVSLFIFCLIKFAKHRSKINTSKSCDIELNREINGVVDHFYFDNDINVKAFVIIFANGEKYINPVFLKGLNGYIERGDSIYKPCGAFKFEIYKKGNSSPNIIEDTVDCNNL